MAAKFTPANATMLELLEGGVPVQQGQAILKEVMSNSLITQLGKYVEMNSPEMEFDVFKGGVNAYWVGEGERIKTSSVQVFLKIKLKSCQNQLKNLNP